MVRVGVVLTMARPFALFANFAFVDFPPRFSAHAAFGLAGWSAQESGVDAFEVGEAAGDGFEELAFARWVAEVADGGGESDACGRAASGERCGLVGDGEQFEGLQIGRGDGFGAWGPGDEGHFHVLGHKADGGVDVVPVGVDHDR